MREWSDLCFSASLSSIFTIEAWCCGPPLNHALIFQNDAFIIDITKNFGRTLIGASLIRIPGNDRLVDYRYDPFL